MSDNHTNEPNEGAIGVTAAAAGVSLNGNGPGAPAQSPIGKVRPTDITSEMQVAYLDYAMSVIVARALPDARDGLKPVQRRILYAMWHDLGLTHDKPHKKSARIVGEVLGKYHPHGDTAVYDAMVRMAQPFSLRYPLVDGQGNFGSIDGDNAAAMRYTEARLAAISNLLLEDLEKDTVDWHPNFDNSLREPDILPAALPTLLINGSSGIAVGMATNIPPHNLGEVVDALVWMIERYDTVDEIHTEQLMQFIKGPDFPTGGIVYRFREERANGERNGKHGASSGAANGAANGDKAADIETVDVVHQGYSTGRTRLVMQAKAHFEEMQRGRSRIVVTELPYQTNKTTLIERIADLVRDGKIEGIADLRDESDRTGMRICIELQRTVEPKSVLADLYKYTPLQQTFGMQLLALVDGQPRMLTLKKLLQHFVEHRREIIRRRSEYELARARERLHIVEGLLKALDILDEVIATIRKSQTVETARKNLIANFKFSAVQAQAILDMQLRRLAALERKKLQEEHDALKQRIAWLEALLASPQKVLDLIKGELLALKESYGDARRTQIVDLTKGAHTTHDLLPEQEVWVTVDGNGDLRRSDAGRFTPTALRQAAKGSDGALLRGNTRDLLYLFTNTGRAAKLGIHEVPNSSTKNMAELTGLSRREGVRAALALPRTNGVESAAGTPLEGAFFFATERGMVKRVALADAAAAINGSTTVMNVDEKDRLGWALRTDGRSEVILVTSNGQAIRFAEDEVRTMGLAAAGVGGVRLDKGARLVYAGVVEPEGFLLTVTGNGHAKLTPLADFPKQGRNGGGVVAHKLAAARTGEVAAALVLPGTNLPRLLAVLAGKGTPRVVELTDIPRQARAASGKPMVEAGSTVTALRWLEGGETVDLPQPEKRSAPPPAAPPVAPTAPAAPRSKPAAPTATPTAATKAVLPVKKATPPAKAVPAKIVPAKAVPAKIVPAKAVPAKAEPVKTKPTKAVVSKAEPVKPALKPAAAAGAAKSRTPAAQPVKTAPKAPAKADKVRSVPAQRAPAQKKAAAPAGPAQQGALFVEPEESPPRAAGKASKLTAATSVKKKK